MIDADIMSIRTATYIPDERPLMNAELRLVMNADVACLALGSYDKKVNVRLRFAMDGGIYPIAVDLSLVVGRRSVWGEQNESSLISRFVAD